MAVSGYETETTQKPGHTSPATGQIFTAKWYLFCHHQHPSAHPLVSGFFFCPDHVPESSKPRVPGRFEEPLLGCDAGSHPHAATNRQCTVGQGNKQTQIPQCRVTEQRNRKNRPFLVGGVPRSCPSQRSRHTQNRKIHRRQPPQKRTGEKRQTIPLLERKLVITPCWSVPCARFFLA